MQKRVVDGMKSTLLRLPYRTITDIYQNFSLHMYSTVNTKFYKSQFFSNFGLYWSLVFVQEVRNFLGET